MAKLLTLNKKPLTWPVRVAIGLALSAPVGYLLLRGRAEALPLLASNAFLWPGATLFGVYFTWALARRSWRHPKPCAPWDRSRSRLIAGTFLRYLLPCFFAGLVVAWLHGPTFESINRILATDRDFEMYGFVTSPYFDGVKVTTPYLNDENGIVLRREVLRDAKPDVGDLVRITLRRGALFALYVSDVHCEKLR
jgi:hypothetical protein